MLTLEKLTPPRAGERIEARNGGLVTPAHPIIPYIEGDGIGVDIWPAARRVLDAAIERAYGRERGIAWFEVFAGEKSHQRFGEWLLDDTIRAFDYYRVGIKGPLTTPIGKGFRSLNVTLRTTLDLFAVVRPVRWFEGVPSPVREPWKVDVVIFREATEDVYAGLEVEAGTPEQAKLREFLQREYGWAIRPDAGIGIKPISEMGSKRLIRKAIQYAIDRGRRSVTFMHKGNIMKYTEAAFMEWGYQVARDEFGDRTVTWDEVQKRHGGRTPTGRILIQDYIADVTFQHLLIRPTDFDVIATPNLNGDYVSDAVAAQVGGIGMAPGGNIGHEHAVFEATHGTAPRHAGLDKVNPSSLILSGVMMLEHLDWREAAGLVIRGMEGAFKAKIVTYDLARLMEGAREVKTSEFAQAVIERM